MPHSDRMAEREDRVLTRLRKLCLSLPETCEVNSWGHPNFRAGKRTFVTFEWFKGRPSIAFRLDTAGIDSLVGRSQFFITPYGRGRWVSLWADGRIRWGLVSKLAHRSYQTVALKRMISALYKNASRKA
jgi:predicted DNA-binding protein (MmcQ/YjbR family)